MIVSNLKSRFKFGLMGRNHNEENMFYPGVDGRERFEANLKTQPLDWIYRNNPISYKYNSLGFRCIEHTLLENDYILFTGCSFTEGVGLHLENTYPYIISQQLNKTYYNLAIGGSGIDMLKNNLIMFLSMMKNKLPKYIVIQWPFTERHCFITENNLTLINSHDDDNTLFKELMKEDRLSWTNYYNKFYVLEYIKTLRIKKVIEIGIDNLFYNGANPYDNLFVPNVLFNGKDLARDLAHPGNLGHKLQAEEILDAIKTM